MRTATLAVGTQLLALTVTKRPDIQHHERFARCDGQALLLSTSGIQGVDREELHLDLPTASSSRCC